MNRPRFQDIRGSALPRVLGTCSTDIPGLASYVNEATEMLLNDPLQPDEGWWGTWGDAVFSVSQAQPYITQPREVARMMLMDVCKKPVRIQNGFYEFLNFGRGLQPNACCSPSNSNGQIPNACGQLLQGYDRGQVYTLGTLLGPATLRLYPSDSADVGKRVIIGGVDQNGQTITSLDALTAQTILGEIVTLNVPFSTTAHQYTSITGIQKDLTRGNVTFHQVDVAGTETDLSVMQFNETAANYRRYFLNGLPANCGTTAGGVVQVNAKVKFEFIPVESDPDYLLIPNIPALIRMCEHLRYSRMDTKNAFAMAEKKHEEALKLLFGQLQHYLGNEMPAISVPIFGSDRTRASFV